jgi:hypothetical protein
METDRHYRIRYKTDADGNDILEYSGDVQSLVDACADEARARREMPTMKPGSHMRKMMSIDPIVLMQIAQEHGLSYFDPAVFEIARGRDYSRFRTVDDKIFFKDRSRKIFLG